MPETQTWTVGRLLSWTTDFLAKHGSESPRLDAEVLLAEARKCERIRLYTDFAETPGEEVRTAFRELVRRRSKGTPVAYLVGHKEFYSLSFRVSPDVLIPRPATEHVVMAVLDRVRAENQYNDRVDIVDVGAGSGAIAVSLAKHLEQARITAVDVSAKALEIARWNAETHGVLDRVALFESDLLEALPAEPSFDMVVSNPPYVTASEYEQLPRDVKDHEPQLALLAGSSGLEVYQRLLPQASQRLRAGGWLVCEMSPMIADSLREAFEAQGDFEDVSMAKDLEGCLRVIQARRRG